MSSDKIRNVCLISQAGTGKTSLSEAMLFDAGATDRISSVEDGHTLSDHTPEEISRCGSMYSAILPLDWDGTKVNLIDTPGMMDFTGETIKAFGASENAVLVLDAGSAISAYTRKLWGEAEARNVRRIIFVNKMDKDGADFSQRLSEARERLDKAVAPLIIPMGSGAGLKGVIDVLSGKAFTFSEGKPSEVPLPSELEGEVESARTILVEAAVETDEELMMRYLDEDDISSEEIRNAVKSAITEGTLFPMTTGSATLNIGVRLLLDQIVSLLPSPADVSPVPAVDSSGNEKEIAVEESGPFSALVFKTAIEQHVGELAFVKVFSGSISSGDDIRNVGSRSGERVGQILEVRGKERRDVGKVSAGDIAALVKLKSVASGDTLAAAGLDVVFKPPEFPKPLISLAIRPKEQKDVDKISQGLTAFQKEDPTFHVVHSPEFGQTIISGMGEVHLDSIIQRLKARYNVDVIVERPRIAYRETITRPSAKSYRHKKQTGGAGQFAEVHMEVKPLPRGGGFEYDTKRIFGGSISSNFFGAIEKGILQSMDRGPLAGYRIVDVRAEIYDGKMHPVDSKDIAFQIAGREVFKAGVSEAGPVLLEPVMKVEVTVPSEYMGDVMGNISGRRGKVLGIDSGPGGDTIRAEVPEAEMDRYYSDLTSMTAGTGLFSMEFSHYEKVPDSIVPRIIKEAEELREKD